MKVNKVFKLIFSDQIYFLTLLIAIMVLIASIFNPAFFTIRNFLNVLNQVSVIGVVAAGATLIMISGNFDISVGSIVGLSCTSAALMIGNGNSVFWSIAFGFVLSVVCGLFNGVVIAKTRTPSFIISMAMLSVYYGISLIITGGITKSLGGKFFQLGRGTLIGTIPNPILVLIIVYVFLHFVLTYTKLGRRIYAVGGNEEAAYLSGVNTDMTKIIVYGMNGMLVGLGAIVLLSRLGSALPSTGSGMELRAIAAVVIGGVPLTGGKGKALGTLLGTILLGLISNVLNMLNISAYYQEVVIGLIITVAVIAGNIGNMKRK
ncbi:MAG: ABC transporter permease [Sphaerochaetaceae bacterium]|nr:ABC transporter permease [Sphaerochaetaceae bacterium]